MRSGRDHGIWLITTRSRVLRLTRRVPPTRTAQLDLSNAPITILARAGLVPLEYRVLNV